jgi:hypothetical protein
MFFFRRVWLKLSFNMTHCLMFIFAFVEDILPLFRWIMEAGML